MEQTFLQIEEWRDRSILNWPERTNAASLWPNPLAASNHVNGKSKSQDDGKRGSSKKDHLTSLLSSVSGKPTTTITYFNCGKSDCSERKGGGVIVAQKEKMLSLA